MKEYKYLDTEFRFVYPDNWVVEEENNILSVFDPIKGVGAIQFSYYHVNDPSKVVLSDELDDYLKGKYDVYNIYKFDNYVCSDYINSGEEIWKYWVFMKGNTIAFITYNCLSTDGQKEEKEVESIINSI